MVDPIQIKDLTYKYDTDGEEVLKKISLTVKKGEWVAIIGHNGSGKSTLSRFLNGLLVPEAGEVIINGMDTRDEDKMWEIRKYVGLVFQNPENQLVGTTVKDDIAFGLENNGVPTMEMEERIRNSAEKVGIAHLLSEEPHRLSGGQKQRLAIAGIIAIQPSVIVLDESTSMLDPQGRKEVIQTVLHLRETENITVISITHDIDEASLADRILVMSDGEIVRDGAPEDILTDEEFLIDQSLDVPFSVKLQRYLLKEGINLNHVTLSLDDLVEELWKLKSNS
ncbi:energy-coupling factor transporter ATPase [Alkalihalobacterium chitinilyticum]|uniref:Energy-coupling factor transporter ATPase n=1 Tax=Alkalihalobacterium chitinilyticum TaxID=2980103 RepID=A0ABT5VK21_9BACI|nr:energy-coupling factor transporter ATPase [Alkalihalobacterium chitinilyticum]MDE5415789.1 energy-coupling factor transporter ATPase [Alkalihalobacterium chitinilyticum]